jgi:hypothetical protein
MNIGPRSPSHVTSEELAAYLDRRLDAISSAALERHLADCADCRADLVDARSLLQSTAASPALLRTARPPRARIWVAAAAVLIIAILPLAQRAMQPRDSTPTVRTTRMARNGIDVLAPREHSVEAATIVFAWRPVEGASTYRLTVTDSSGTPLFTTATTDTSAAPPAGTVFRRGSAYLWYVDGLTTDGQTMSSGVRSFTTQR